jgi:hypothetical protein
MKSFVSFVFMAMLAASCSLDFDSLQGGLPDSGRAGDGAIAIDGTNDRMIAETAKTTNTGTSSQTSTATAGSCLTGYHDGGAGVCVASGTCSTGFQNGGSGICVVSGTCSTGYHDGGVGVCLVSGTCSTGYQINSLGSGLVGSLGTCVFPGTCVSGYQNIDGICVQLGALGWGCSSSKPCQPVYTCRSGICSGG